MAYVVYGDRHKKPARIEGSLQGNPENVSKTLANKKLKFGKRIKQFEKSF